MGEEDSRMVRLQSFSIRDARCSVEADRLPVYENIRIMLAAERLLERDMSVETALHCFDQLVRDRLPRPIQASTQWRHFLVLGVPVCGRALDMLAADIAGGATLQVTVMRFINYLLVAVFVFPGFVLSASWFSRRCLHCHICTNVLYTFWIIVVEFLFVFSWYFVHNFLLGMIHEHDTFFGALVALDSLELCVSFVPFILRREMWGASRLSRSHSSTMCGSLPVPIGLEGTTRFVREEEAAHTTQSVCEEEAALPIHATSFEPGRRFLDEVTEDLGQPGLGQLGVCKNVCE